MTTRREAIKAAGYQLARARVLRDSLPPRQAAEIAYCSSGPSVDEIERRIRVMRGLPEYPPARTAQHDHP